MQITVLGGAGDMGGEVVRQLVNTPEVEKVIIADLNLKKAEEKARELGAKASAVKVDAFNHQNLVEVISGNDSVVNCIGPSTRFEKLIIKAAIEARSSTVSLCDDSHATLQVLELEESAKNAGATILLGLGNCPGLTNLFAKMGAMQMDKVEKVKISWMGGADDAKGLANFEHAIEIFVGTVPAIIEGKQIEVKAGTGKEIIEFPAPIGKLPVYYTPHAEPVTIPRYIKGLKEMTIKGGIQPSWLSNLALIFKRLGLINTPQARHKWAEIFHALLPKIMRGKKKYIYSALRTEVEGKKEEKDVHYWFASVDRIKLITAIPAAIGAIMLAQGKIKETGIFSPEQIIEPEPFLEEVQKRGIKIYQG